MKDGVEWLQVIENQNFFFGIVKNEQSFTYFLNTKNVAYKIQLSSNSSATSLLSEKPTNLSIYLLNYHPSILHFPSPLISIKIYKKYFTQHSVLFISIYSPFGTFIKNTLEDDMTHQQPNKYSIKYKLKELRQAQQQSLYPYSPSHSQTYLNIHQHQQPNTNDNHQSNNKIYMPEFHNYFLHTIEKEIKHEGNLLRIIKKKIDDFKEKQDKKKRIKNSKNHYSHLMFNSPNFKQSGSTIQSPKGTMTMLSTPKDQHRTLACSTATTARQSLKTKTTSFSSNCIKQSSEKRVNTACGTRQVINLNAFKTFMPSRSSVYSENQLIQKFGKLVKHTKKFNSMNEGEFSITGSKPQWNTFQSYRNNNAYIIKKTH